MNEKKILVGTIDYPVSKRVVQNDVDVIELSATYGVTVKASTAKKWRKEAGENLGFSLQVPKHIIERPPSGTPLPGDLSNYGSFKVTRENLQLWKNFTKVAEALNARTLVLLTPASFTPSKANLEAFGTFLETVRKESDVKGPAIAWEPKGPWEMEQAGEFAVEQGILLAVDPLRDSPPVGSSAYFRLGPFAVMGSRVGIYDLERIRDAAIPFEKVTCVFQTNRALDDARNLKKILD